MNIISFSHIYMELATPKLAICIITLPYEIITQLLSSLLFVFRLCYIHERLFLVLFILTLSFFIIYHYSINSIV